MTAALMVGWVALACFGLRRMSLGTASGPILFAGLAVIFALSLLPRRR